MIWTGWTEIDMEANARTAALEVMGTGRPDGLHLSGIIRARRRAAKLAEGAPAGDQAGVRLQEGFLWESAVEYMLAGAPRDEAIELAFKRFMLHLRENVVTQLRLEREGIHMTPDAFDPYEGVLESYKVTRKKLPWTQGEFEKKFWPWLEAEAAYCLTAGVDTVVFYVLFQCGDYSRGEGTGPRAMTSRCTWTLEELEENWQTLMLYRNEAEEERNGGEQGVPTQPADSGVAPAGA